MQKLKPCPFCGGVAFLNSNFSNRYRTYFVYSKCEICNAQGKTYASKDNPPDTDWSNAACESAVEAWNMRTPNRQ